MNLRHPQRLPAGSAAPPACRHCGGPAVTGEGAAVCKECIYRYGSVAAHPERLSQGEAAMLLEAHGDRVSLAYVAARGQRGRLVWVWRETLGEWR